MKLYQLIGGLFFLSLFSGCASKPTPDLYFLDHASTQVVEQKFRERIGLAEVILPSYARKEKIASLTDRHRIFQDDNHRWAEPPEVAVSVAFTRALEFRLNRSVLLQPYPRALAPALQVKIVFDRFLRGPDSQAQLSGQYLLLADEGSEVLAIVRFQYAVSADSPDYPGYMGAILKAIALISDRIAADIEERS